MKPTAAIAFSVSDKNIGVIIMGVIAMLLMFFEISDFAEKVSSSEYGFLFNKGLGYYLMIIGSVGIVIFGVGKMIMKKNR